MKPQTSLALALLALALAVAGWLGWLSSDAQQALSALWGLCAG